MASTTAQQGGPAPGRPAAGAPRGPAGGPGARISASLWRRSWLRATLTLTPPLAWFLVIYLASLRGHAGDRVLDGEPVHQHARAQLDAQQLPAAVHQHLPDHHRPDHRDGRPGHGHRRGAGFPVRLLHGPGGQPSWPAAAVHRRAAAAVGQLHRPGVRLDRDPAEGRHAELVLHQDRPRGGQHRLHEHRDVAGVLLHLAAVHDRPCLRRRWSGSRTPCWRRPGTSARATGARCAACCSRSRCPGWWPARSSRSR